jgi:hypothetical protein
MAYSAAAEGVMDDPLPIGMGLKVPVPASNTLVNTPQTNYAHYTQQGAGQVSPSLFILFFALYPCGAVVFMIVAGPFLLM